MDYLGISRRFFLRSSRRDLGDGIIFTLGIGKPLLRSHCAIATAADTSRAAESARGERVSMRRVASGYIARPRPLEQELSGRDRLAPVRPGLYSRYGDQPAARLEAARQRIRTDWAAAAAGWYTQREDLWEVSRPISEWMVRKLDPQPGA